MPLRSDLSYPIQFSEKVEATLLWAGGVASSPWGTISLLWDQQNDELYKLGFTDKVFPQTPSLLLLPAVAQAKVDALLAGDRLPCRAVGSRFQLKVWQALCQVSAGQTVSYQELAHAIGMAKASRAVGQAVGRNPLAWIIPCHRVLPKNQTLGNYRWGAQYKKALLAYEPNRFCPELKPPKDKFADPRDNR